MPSQYCLPLCSAHSLRAYTGYIKTPSQDWCHGIEVVRIFISHISRSFEAVMFHSMMLCEIIPLVVCTFIPIHFYVSLCFSVSKPMVAHVPRFRSLHLDIIMYKSTCYAIICFYGGWWLGVAHFCKDGPHWDTILSICKYPPCFSFCRWWHNMFECFIFNVYWCVKNIIVCFEKQYPAILLFILGKTR